MADQTHSTERPELTVPHSWRELLLPPTCEGLERALPSYLAARRWFGGKARTIRSVAIVASVPIPVESPQAELVLVTVTYTEGPPETYRLPLTFRSIGEAEGAAGVVARVAVGPGPAADQGLLCEAMGLTDFLSVLFQVVAREGRFRGPYGEVVVTPTAAFRDRLLAAEDLPPSVMKAEQSNTSVVYGDRFILKLYRRAEAGINPDLEIGRFLTERNFPNIAQVASALEHRRDGDPFSTVLLLQQFLPNRGDAWRYTLEHLGDYYARIRDDRDAASLRPPTGSSPLRSALEEIPASAREHIGPYLEQAALLGRRTAELHVALSQSTEDPNFAPEPFTDAVRDRLFHDIEELIRRQLLLLRQRAATLPEPLRDRSRHALDLEPAILARLKGMQERTYRGLLIRCHGDYHLGQVLYTGQDFIIIDFEGEPARPLSLRRMKGSPLRDVAGMLRSFHYAAYAAGRTRPTHGTARAWEPAARAWYHWTAAGYLRAYLDVTRTTSVVPASIEELGALLDAFLVEKAAYELGYELNNRPDWVGIPLEGMLHLMEPPH